MRSRLLLTLALCLALALDGCGASTLTAEATFTPPHDWRQVDAQHHFTFWVPSDMVEQPIHGMDSYVGLWQSDDLTVRFDYGSFSGGLDSTVAARPHTTKPYRVSEHEGTIVQYTDESGLSVVLLLLPRISGDTSLTFEASAKPAAGGDVPLLIVKSVRLGPA